MTISVPNQIGEQVEATNVQIKDDILQVSLSDGRIISVPLAKIPWLQWLHNATPEQQVNWSIEPGGFAIYWDDLDNGIEVAHLLTLTTLVVPEAAGGSPLDVEGVDLDLTKEEIIQFIHDGRKHT